MPMQLCRICGGTINLIPILAVDTELHEKLLVCANIRITTSDSLPRHICAKCEQSLDLSYRLRKQSEATEERLRLKLKEEPNQEEIETQYEEIEEEFINISEHKHVVVNNVSEAYQIDEVHIKENIEVYMEGVEGSNNNMEELESDVNVSVADNASFISSQGDYVVEKMESETVDVDLCSEAEASNYKGDNYYGDAGGIAKRSSYSCALNTTKDVHFSMEEHIYKCSFCSKTFPTFRGMNRHTGIAHNTTSNNDHKCSQCDRSYNRRSSLLRHIRLTHNEVADSIDMFQENSHKCNTCLRRFRTLDDLNTHEEIHISNLINKLSRPSTSSSSSSEITRFHEKMYYCGYCGKESNNSSEHKSHLKSHVKDRIYSCSICQKKFHTMASLLTHERVHVENYVCDMCNRGFCEMKDLRQHKLIHQKASHVCHICQRSYVKESNLKMHVLREHKDALPFRCALCPEGFFALSHLKVHASEIHGRSILHDDNVAVVNSEDDKNTGSYEVASESLKCDAVCATHTDSILLSDTSSSDTELAPETLEYRNRDNLVAGTPESMQHTISPQTVFSSPTIASRNILDSIIIESSSDTDVASESLEIEYKHKIKQLDTKYTMLIEPSSQAETVQNNLADIIIESSNSSVINLTKEMDKEPRKITKSRIKGRKGRRTKFIKGYKIKDS